jgi:hypothetical protein
MKKIVFFQTGEVMSLIYSEGRKYYPLWADFRKVSVALDLFYMKEKKKREYSLDRKKFRKSINSYLKQRLDSEKEANLSFSMDRGISM